MVAGHQAKNIAASVVVVAALVSSACANTYLNYSEWQNQSPDARINYVMGMYDMLVTLADSDAGVRRGRHYGSCVSKAQLGSRELAENVRLFGATKPELHLQPVNAIFLRYLVGLCGSPPSN
jgi:hypothetical protein